MTRLYLIRHGKAAAGFHEHVDPGLSALGHEQANAVAQTLAQMPPVGILSSPYLRARETAAPLARLWQTPLAISEAATEIPAPAELATRQDWLQRIMQMHWADVAGEPLAWRQQTLTGLLAVRSDHVVFTHFLTVNVVVGAALRDDRVVCANPGNTSITAIDHDGRNFSLAET